MEIKELINRIDFLTTGDNLIKEIKSEKVMKEMLNQYYIEGLTQIEVAENFGINNMWFTRKEFPKIESVEDKCEYCHVRMLHKFPSKSEIKRNFLEQAKCEFCGHSTKENCDCLNCIKKGKNRIVEIYDFKEPIPIDELTLKDYLSIATLMQGYYLEEDDLIIPSFKNTINKEEIKNMFGSFDKLYEVITNLFYKNAIGVSPKSNISAFDLKTYGFYVDSVNYTFKNLKLNYEHKEEWLNEFKYPNLKELNINDKMDLWTELVTNELIKIFEFHAIEKHHFSFPSDPEEKNDMLSLLKDSIYDWLSVYTPAETYCIIFAGIGRAVSLRSQYGMKHHQSQIKYLTTAINKWLENNKSKSGKIIPYDYPVGLEVSQSTRIFFNQIIGVEDWFNTLVPKKEITKVIDDTNNKEQTTLDDVLLFIDKADHEERTTIIERVLDTEHK